MIEIWKDIKEFEGRYQVSNLGRIKRLAYSYRDTWGVGRFRFCAEKIISQQLRGNGYYTVSLQLGKKRKLKYVHRLVAEAFLPNPNALPYVNHKDVNPKNNCVDNLEWCTPSYNTTYANSRKKSVETRRRNGSYVMKQEQKDKIRNALKGKPKSELHKQHIKEGKNKHKNLCERDDNGTEEIKQQEII